MSAKRKLAVVIISTLFLFVEGGPDVLHAQVYGVSPLFSPKVPDHGGAVSHPVDAFLNEQFVRNGLEPLGEADRQTLIRRVTLDLTGLPPTPEEMADFLRDDRPDAFERLVDRLLASPAYGERMATVWLDWARYADTNGYEHDNGRNMWPWRDWVIRSLNENKPFDEFTVEQLAGDLLPGATYEQRLATGFHRNHGLNFEGGSISEESRWNYVHDRVHTTATIWLGLTLSCARCHDHKYDPITQKEYYQFAAYFNNIDESGYAGEKGNAPPLMRIDELAYKAACSTLREQLAKWDTASWDPTDSAFRDYQNWKARILTDVDAAPTPPQDMLLHFACDEADGLTERVSGNEAKALGKVRWTSGQSGEALHLDGNLIIDLGSHCSFERDMPFSISLWCRPEGPAFGTIVGKIQYSGYDVCWREGKFVVHLVHRWDTSLITIQTQRQFPEKQWAHVAVSYDGTGKAAGLHVYVNGKREVCDVLFDTLDGSIVSHTNLLLGARHEGDTETFVGCIDDVRIYERSLSPVEVALLAEDYSILAALEKETLSSEQEQSLRQHYIQLVDPTWRNKQAERRMLQRKLTELQETWPTVMVMAERPDRRPTYVLIRGQYDQLGEEVSPGLPTWLASGEVPQNRLELAHWLMGPSNPLTARVIANRQWELFFGRGLVVTSDDLGTQGEPPSHPELLDWLAAELRRDWDLKRIHRLIVTSAAYRRSCRATEQLIGADPENRFFARQVPRRLTAEMIRDATLAATGLLDRTMGGPGVHPYQPPGLWSELAFHGEYSAQQDLLSQGRDLYRRSIYTYWKRSCPPAFHQVFDAPEREICQVKRPCTATPLQALALMNDPTFLQAAGHLALRMVTMRGDTSERLNYVFLCITQHTPSERQLRAVEGLLESARQWYSDHPEALEQLARQCATVEDPVAATPLWAAWTIAIHSVLASEDALVRD